MLSEVHEKKGCSFSHSYAKKSKKKRGKKPANFKLIYKQRYKVERCFAWMDNFPRLVIVYEQCARLYRGFCVLACIMMCLRHF
ncbi:transposase [Hazenella sp. IB182357]|uniref:Transposase n=1 Tax=Polycladospora coralii TaxID=2771432 RepID=A0A926N8Y6_9BACL|nr:transposase [Polycladospora coralii]MBS7529349.1 transposase [Polycladospora coralii]